MMRRSSAASVSGWVLAVAAAATAARAQCGPPVVVMDIGQSASWHTLFHPLFGETYFRILTMPDPAIVALDWPQEPAEYWYSPNAQFSFTGVADGETALELLWFNEPGGLTSTCSIDVFVVIPPPGACALTNGNCLEMPYEDCVLLGGAFQGGGTFCPPCPIDLTGDGRVDALDLQVLLLAYGSEDYGDLDNDGDTDQHDLGILLAHYQCRTTQPPAHAGSAAGHALPLRLAAPAADPCVAGYDHDRMHAFALPIAATDPLAGLNFTSADVRGTIAESARAAWRFFHHPAGDGLPALPASIEACPSLAVGTHLRSPGGAGPVVITITRGDDLFRFTWCDTNNASDGAGGAPGGVIAYLAVESAAGLPIQVLHLEPSTPVPPPGQPRSTGARVIGSVELAVTVAATGGELVEAVYDIIASPRSPGDADGDGDVDVFDLLLVLGTWGDCPAPCPPRCDADLDFNCTVNIFDLLTVLGNWGQ
jgi:hypothetical protein